MPECEDPTPILGELVGGSGYVRCKDGRVLREAAIMDLPGNPGQRCGGHQGEDGDAFFECRQDSECTARPFGACIIDWGATRGGACVCEYRCMSDLDCRIGQVCLANGVAGESQKKCVEASNCRTNADCESGQCEVSRDDSLSFGGDVSLGCRSPQDECSSMDDCVGRGCGFCVLGAGRWRCAEECFQLGRPFLVDGEAVLPALAAGSAWIDPASVPSCSLDNAEAQCAAAHWLACARMEHASVAAFARFALQLMHLGASPDLLQSTTEAMQDEIAHAKVCFALAKRYSDQALSAGPLEVSQALEHELEPARIAVDVFLEGCVGESVAALEASEMSRLSKDPAVTAVLEKIAKDEHEHALLAWRTLGWMLDNLGAQEKGKVVQALTQLLVGLREELKGPAAGMNETPDELELHGVPSAQRKNALRRQALAQLVLPCASALLAQANHVSEPQDLRQSRLA